MSRADAYRQIARECARIAARATQPSDQCTWFGLAESWMRLAAETAGAGTANVAATERGAGDRRESDLFDPRVRALATGPSSDAVH